MTGSGLAIDVFCVVCGKETEEELRGGVCADCFLEKNALATIAENVDVEVCVHCNARKRGEVWLYGHERVEPILEEAVREAVKWERVVDKPRAEAILHAEDERNFTVQVIARGMAEGLAFEKHLTTRSRIKNGTCLRCSRVQGGYYEAIVQIRAANRELDLEEKRAIRQLASRFIERIVTEGDRNAFVLRDLEEHGGLDIYMGTTNSGRMLAKQLANEYGGKITEHPKTVGQKDGLDLIRMTFALRIPEFRAGDYIVLRDQVYEVTSMGMKTIALLEPLTGRQKHIERTELDRAYILPRKDAKEAVVVSHSGNELQILDPTSYQTVTVLKPAHLTEVGETVEVLRHDGELIVLRPKKAQVVDQA